MMVFALASSVVYALASVSMLTITGWLAIMQQQYSLFERIYDQYYDDGMFLLHLLAIIIVLLKYNY